MTTRLKIATITLAFGIPAFLLGPVIWPPSPDIRPTPEQMPYLIALSAIEALTFGFGVAFIFLGWPLVKRLARGQSGAARTMYLSLAWVLVSWWPHDNMHIHNALNINGLIVIDWTFHFTLIAAGLALAWSFFAIFKQAAAGLETEGACPADQPDCHLTPARP